MNLTSGEGPADTSELELAGLRAAPSERVAPPRVAESPLALECRVERLVEVGEPTSYLVLAEVLCLQVDPAVLTDGLPDPDKLRPLARLGGRGYAQLGELLEIARPRIEE
jgi:flavin reductase (DIM6/NTAB) family NADH-FMN oxidoreductase RutF